MATQTSKFPSLFRIKRRKDLITRIEKRKKEFQEIGKSLDALTATLNGENKWFINGEKKGNAE